LQEPRIENVQCISAGVRMAGDAFLSPLKVDIFPGEWCHGSAYKVTVFFII